MTLKCTMILGDCLEVLADDRCIAPDFIFCDPPYGVLNANWDVKIPTDDLWTALKIRSQLAVSVFTASLEYGIELIYSNKKSFSYELIWIKPRGTGAFHAKRRPLRAHEMILVFAPKSSVYNPQMRDPNRHRRGTIKKPGYGASAFGPIKPSSYIYSDQVYPLSWLPESPKHARHKYHSSEKPIGLMDWLIRTYSNEGNNVLDPTSGSGTTAIAALSCGRNVTCIEKDAGYFEAAVDRVRKHVRNNLIRAEIEVIR